MPAVKPIPDGYHSVQPYLIVNNGAAALDFYKKAFGGKGALPHGKRRPHRPRRNRNRRLLRHARRRAPEMGFRSPEHYSGSPVSLVLYVPDCDAVYKQAVSAGAKSEREPADQFYGDRMATVLDPFGFSWHIATHIKDVSPEEMRQHG